MHVWIDAKYMYTNFGGCGFIGFGDTATLLTMDYSPWSSKSSIDQNRPKKFMQVCIDVTCMYTNFGGRGLFGFGDTATLKNGQISLSDHGL